jgi:phosphatidylglycerol:prolipoprotein diacylglycerol transferase
LIKAWTGYDLPLPLAMFGLFVGIAIVVASAVFKAEVRRLFALGRIGPARVRIRDDKGAKRTADVPPEDIVSDLTLVVMFTGIIGARLFHILDHLPQFFADPGAMIFSGSGLSIFGGLILGTLAGLLCLKRWQLPIRPLLDAAAPAMMLGYAIGRIGCQVSGDGDWGIASDMVLKPAWLPTWFWAQTYDHNIFGATIAWPGVYPTPFYETLMGLACFAVLWALRRHLFRMGWLFSVYLVLAGAERLLIEQIRVNPVFAFAGLHATQAELIATVLMVLGLAGALLLSRRTSARLAAP